MDIVYYFDRAISTAQFADVLERSTLAARRPVADLPRLAEMLRHANLLCTAWQGDLLVGVARSLTDFSFCCYMSDLAVDTAHQKQGIGRELIRRTRSRLHPECKIILLAAPQAEGYYPKIGFWKVPSAWMLRPEDRLGAPPDSTT